MPCSDPIYSKTIGGITGCGQCFTCRIQKRRKWTLRLLLENMLHEKSFFCTLTYAPQFAPIEYTCRDTGQLFGVRDLTRLPPFDNGNTLCLSDPEKFLKRIRDKLPSGSLRYFYVGEYGEDHFRPHYHFLFFGLDPDKFHLVRDAWIDVESGEQLGLCTLDAPHLNSEIIQYVCGYAVKKMTKDDDVRLNGRYPEFINHSRSIGLGAVPYIVDALGGVSGLSYIQNFRDVPRQLRFNGRNWPIDRYLREKILEHLNVKEPLMAEGRSRYKKEMLHLQIRHKPDPRFSPSEEYLLSKQYGLENAQSILNITKRSKLYKKGDKL